MVSEMLKPEKIKKLSSAQAAWIFGVLYDKHRLHTGKSTANVATLTSIIQAAQEDDT